MFLEKIKLANFKNWAAASIEFCPRLNCLTGLNGMGKTNLLDAVHTLCLTKSFTGASDRHLVRQGEAFFRLEGFFEKEGRAEAVVAKMQPPAPKQMARNGSPLARMADHVGQFPVVMAAPGDEALVRDGSEERRRFLDSTLSQISPGYLSNLLVFNQLLKNRNALLKNFWEQKQFDAPLLEAIDRQMTGPAGALSAERRGFVEGFSEGFQFFYEKISGGRERVGLSFESWPGAAGFGEILEKNRDRDRHLQRTAEGPHRDDLALSLDGQPARRWASQGQLKSFLLAMRLAQHQFLKKETGQTPILLLDDIFDKLDEGRVAGLVEILADGGRFGQVFITDAHGSRMASILEKVAVERRFFEIENGAVVL